MDTNYVIKSTTTQIDSSVNQFNQVVNVKKTVTDVFDKKLTCTKGMSLMKKISILDIQVDTCTSNTDVRLFAHMIKRHGQRGFVTNGAGKPIGINELAELFSVSRKKVSSFVASLISAGLLFKHKRNLYVNPYLNLPYGNSGKDNRVLQLMWDDKYEHSYDEVAGVTSIDTSIEVTNFEPV